jgi:hypothetical protein
MFIGGTGSSWVMIVGVSSGHCPMLVCLMMVRLWSSASDTLSLAHCFPLLSGWVSFSLDDSGSCGKGVGGSCTSGCVGLE